MRVKSCVDAATLGIRGGFSILHEQVVRGVEAHIFVLKITNMRDIAMIFSVAAKNHCVYPATRLAIYHAMDSHFFFSSKSNLVS